MTRKKPSAPVAAEAAPAPGRRRAFLAITLLLPLALFGAAELLLRATGTGALEPLFVPVPQAAGFLQPNPDAVQRFFPDPAAAPDVSIDTTWFPARKPDRGLRVFVQGESSAAGFPYGRWASPGALLAGRLQATYPDRDVEVINTGMAAVTSYVLLDFADEIIAQQPDAVVIYTGHNEYLGIGGVGSSYASAKSPAVARAVLALRRLHLYRALERLLASLGGQGAPLARSEGTLMSRVARERSIPLDSELFRRGLEQFEGNLNRLLAKYRAAGIQVFIGTLASNLRDQPPFVSGPQDEPGGSADESFKLARQHDAAGRYDAARSAYVAAKDRDQLRFRAPEAFNEVIRRVAAHNGATVVESEAALSAAARNGIIGSDLMLEHVHPNVEGYFRLASSFYGPIVAGFGAGRAVDEATARRDLPVTEVDRLQGQYRVELLKNDWPFVPERRPVTLPTPRDRIEEIAQLWFAGRLDWLQAMGQALTWYEQQGNDTEAARVAVNLADAVINAADPQYVAGRQLLKANDPARGERYLRRAIRLDGTRVEYRMSLAQAQFMQGRVQDSIATLEAILAEHPDDERARYWLDQMKGAAGPR
jgi:lysophospholipase L1-like esterase